MMNRSYLLLLLDIVHIDWEFILMVMLVWSVPYSVGVIFVIVCCGGLSGLLVLWLLVLGCWYLVVVLGCWFLPSSDECVLFLVGKNL